MRFITVDQLQNFLADSKNYSALGNVVIWEASQKSKEVIKQEMHSPMIGFYPENGAFNRVLDWIMFGDVKDWIIMWCSLKDVNIIPNGYNDWAWFSTEEEAREYANPQPFKWKIHYSGLKMIEAPVSVTFTIDDALIKELMVVGQEGVILGNRFNKIAAIKYLRGAAIRATGVHMGLAVCKETIEQLMREGKLYAR